MAENQTPFDLHALHIFDFANFVLIRNIAIPPSGKNDYFCLFFITGF